MKRNSEVAKEVLVEGMSRQYHHLMGAKMAQKSSNLARTSEKQKKGFRCKVPKTLYIIGEPCRNRTDNLMIKSHALSLAILIV